MVAGEKILGLEGLKGLKGLKCVIVAVIGLHRALCKAVQGLLV